MGATHVSQKRYPPELKERAVRMARDAIAEQGGQTFGVVPRIARQLGVGVESLRGGSPRPRSTLATGRARRAPTRSASPSWSGRSASSVGRMTS